MQLPDMIYEEGWYGEDGMPPQNTVAQSYFDEECDDATYDDAFDDEDDHPSSGFVYDMAVYDPSLYPQRSTYPARSALAFELPVLPAASYHGDMDRGIGMDGGGKGICGICDSDAGVIEANSTTSGSGGDGRSPEHTKTEPILSGQLQIDEGESAADEGDAGESAADEGDADEGDEGAETSVDARGQGTEKPQAMVGTS